MAGAAECSARSSADSAGEAIISLSHRITTMQHDEDGGRTIRALEHTVSEFRMTINNNLASCSKNTCGHRA
jgi:hypothetical protein